MPLLKKGEKPKGYTEGGKTIEEMEGPESGPTKEQNAKMQKEFKKRAIKKDSKKDIKKMLSEAKKLKNIKQHNTSDDVLKAIFNVIETNLPDKINKHKVAEDVINAVFNVAGTNTKKTKPVPSRKDAIDILADSIINHPEYNNITKSKFERYSFDRINKFNERYPDLLLKLFKTKEAVNTLLKKKSDSAQKRKLSEEKAIVKKKELSEKGKKERLEKRIKKYKHFDDMTDVELSKFKQARAYYMRKSKTSTILPKNLNKEDPEALTNVCKALAERGFNTMSEKLFMDEYEG
jgi:hypothetical protein